MSRRGVVVALVVALVVGFVVWRVVTARDMSPVPVVAQGPYLCDGVPREGAELILGGSVQVTRSEGEWGSDGPSFACTIERGGGMINVYEEPIRSGLITDLPSWLEYTRSLPEVEEFWADAPGHGFVRTDGPTVADWVCGDRYLTVVISGVHGRDRDADAVAYLSSMLPWACGDAEPPEADSRP